jgi:pyruvate dehydrogenase E2 component (dihydrolipoamide acetyltransferase)
MAKAVIMPKVDMVMETGTFVEWLQPEGAEVDKGDPLFVILTDKASIEIEAPASGILAGIRAEPDDVIPVTEVIAYILEPGESLPEEAEPELTPAVVEPTAARPEPAAVAPKATQDTDDGKIRATPVARRLAREMGINLANLSGGGPRGRIHKADVLAAAEAVEQEPVAPAAALGPAVVPTAAPSVQVPLPSVRQKRVVPLTGPRKIIADRMAHSAFTAPHITLSLRVDMTEAVRMRARLLEPIEARSGHKLSLTAIIARAVASVLPAHPFLNASLNGEEIILWEDVHLGIATSVEDYLIVPVIQEANTKSLEQLVVELNDLVERGRSKHLTPSEMSGSTFTISNLGMFGIESFTAIINPPETAILAVGKMVQTPVQHGDGLASRPLLNITLSADHRVVDGAGGARFLADLKATLENPYLLI